MSKRKTTTIIGQEWPVMAELSDGWFLVACDGGPAVGKVWPEYPNGGFVGVLDRQHEDLPEHIRSEAIDKFVHLAWPSMKAVYMCQCESRS